MRLEMQRQWWRVALALFGFLSLTSMALMSVGGTLFVVASVVFVAMAWRRGERREIMEVVQHPLNLASLLLFAACLLSLVAAWIFPPAGQPVGVEIFSALKKFHHFLYPPLIAFALLRTSDQPERHPLWSAWAAVAVIVSGAAFLQFFGGDIFPADWLKHRFFRAIGETKRFHGQGFMFFHLSFASCLCFVAAAGLARWLFPLRWDSVRTRWAWGALGLIACAAVYFSFSRIGLVALGALIAAVAFLRRPLLGVFAAGAVVLVAMTLWAASPSLRARFEQNMAGNMERVVMWESAWAMFKDRPLTGFGMGDTAHYTPIYAERLLGHRAEFTSHAHNNVLDQVAATGLLGLAAFLFWWGVLFVESWRCFDRGPADERWLPAAALAAFLAFQVNGLTQVNFWDGKSQHTLMLWAGVTLAISLRQRRRERSGRA